MDEHCGSFAGTSETYELQDYPSDAERSCAALESIAESLKLLVANLNRSPTNE